MPALASLIFVLCFSSFATVMALGGGPAATTLEVAIYQALRFDFELDTAAQLACWHLLLCGAALLLHHRLGSPSPSHRTAARQAPRPDRAGWLGRCADALWLAIALLLFLPPLAAIVSAAQSGAAAPDSVALPLWVLAIGAIGISLGLALFGPRLIRTVGEKITKMVAIRAYCVAQAAAVTVLLASALGLPVSSTHIAIGGIFGVGLLREALTNRGVRRRTNGGGVIEAAPAPPRVATAEDELVQAAKREKRRLVRRRHAWGIAAAWVVTVPAAGLLAAALYGLLILVTRI